MSERIETEREERPAGGSARLSPYCAHLASKKLAFSQRLPMREEDVLDASNHCWCRVTQKVIGPDKSTVRPSDCVRGRSCYVSPFAVHQD
ncbi:MAG: hypothetical protein R3F34_06180 [Planctomycetota bacterium]